MNAFLSRKAAEAPPPASGEGSYGAYIGLTGAVARDHTDSVSEVIVNEAIDAFNYDYIRWVTQQGALEASYDTTHSGGLGTTSGKNGVITLTNAGVYEISLSLSVDMVGSLSMMAFARVDVFRSDGSTVVTQREFGVFLRTAENGRGDIVGVFPVNAPAGSCVRVLVRKGTHGSTGFEVTSAHSSITIKRLA